MPDEDPRGLELVETKANDYRIVKFGYVDLNGDGLLDPYNAKPLSISGFAAYEFGFGLGDGFQYPGGQGRWSTEVQSTVARLFYLGAIPLLPSSQLLNGIWENSIVLDINKDGILDWASRGYLTKNLAVLLGNGAGLIMQTDGSMETDDDDPRARREVQFAGNTWSKEDLIDIDSDGYPDRVQLI